MKYRKGEKVIEASPRAFRVVYAAQGYVPVTEQPTGGMGHAVENAKPDTAGTNEDSNVSSSVAKVLEDMSVTELRKLAKEKGLVGYSSLSKNDLLEVLKEVGA